MNKSLLLSHRATPGLAFLRPLFRSVCIIGPIFCFAQLLLGVDDEIATTINTDVSTFVATGNGYDAYAGAVSRTATDLVVPGATSSHGLVLQRTYSSTLSGGWNFSPLWGIDTYTTPPGAGTLVVHFPDGRSMGFNAPTQAGETAKRAAPGTKERLFVTQTTADLYLEDGSRVHFSKTTDTSGNDAYLITWFTLQYLVDPYGQTTTFAWEYYDFYGTPPHIRLKQVTDPSGRTLTYTYDPVKKLYPTQVTASTGEWVKYTWENIHWSSPYVLAAYQDDIELTRVDYSDGSFATYGYDLTWTTRPNFNGSCCQNVQVPKLVSAQDTRAEGPMQAIQYEYQVGGEQKFEGTLSAERHFGDGALVSGFTHTADRTQNTDTRGDGPMRTFNIQKINGNHLLTSKSDFSGRFEYFNYDANNYLNKFTDRRNNITQYTNEPILGRPKQITHPDGSHIDQTYTAAANPYYLASRTDENGHRTDYTRDSNNRITRKDYPADSNGVREYETFTYNNFGEVVTHRMRNGAYQHFAYDGSTSLTLPPGSRGLLTDKCSPTWTADPVVATANEPKTHYEYYSAADYGGVWTDRIKTETDPRGLVTQYDYDRAYDANGQNSGLSTSQAPVAGRGLVTRATHVSDNGNYQSFAYDKYGNKLWEENELRQHTSYTYDDYRRLVTVTNPLNQTLTNTYTPTNGSNPSPYLHTTNSIYTTTTPTGIVTKNIYDANFRKTSMTHADGTSLAATTTVGYDPVGNPTSVTDPLNHSTTTAYDNRNRKITVTNALNQSTQYFYDAASNVTSIQRADGTAETKTYDQINRVLTDTVPQTSTVNVTTTFAYYPGNVQYSGLPKQVIDADGHITTFSAYDPSGLKTTVTYPNGDMHGFTYDNDHNLISRRTVNGTTQNFTYDNRNRKITMVWANPTNVTNFTAEWANFGYDAASRLSSAQNGIGAVGTGITSTITRQYDAAGRLILDRQNLNATLGNKDVQYLYDADGKDTRLYLTSAGYDYTFSYDAMGRFEKIFVTGTSNPSFQYRYDAASNEVERDNLANSVNQFYTRDALNRMSRRDLKLTAAVLSSEAYGYDAMSRMLSVAREDGKTDSFTYYLDGELWTAQYGQPNPTRTVTYNIDPMGNRTNVVDTGVTTNYGQAAGGLNQYSQVGINTVGNGSEHEIALYQGISYGYVNDERLASVTGNGNSYQLLYDALGRCVKRTLNGVTTYYIYDGEKPIVEYNSAGSITARNLYGKSIDEILMRTDATLGTFYCQDDHEGSVTQLIDGSGNIVEKYRYDVFGVPTILSALNTQLSTSAYNNRFLFTGREYTSTFGIYEYRARAYHPGLGRFTGEDPKGFDAGDYNLFRYVGNEPLDRTDPMGLVGIDNWTSYTDVPPPPPPVTVAPAATAAAAQQTSSISMAYARGSGFTDSQWKKFDQAQQGAANRLANASARIDNALEHGGKELNAVTKAFEKVFGRDSATAENMSKRSGIMKGMMTALRDDGSKGYIANAMSESSRTLGRGVVGGKTIEINVAHRSFGDSSALTWAAGHESGHNMGLGHGTLNGVTAYKYGNEAERSAYKNLPPSERLGNPDNYMDFAR